MEETLFNKLAIGASAGLIIGPWVGLTFIRFAHVGYLETRFAIIQIIYGRVFNVMISVLGCVWFGERLVNIGRRMVLLLLGFAIIVDIAEFVVIIRRIIP